MRFRICLGIVLGLLQGLCWADDKADQQRLNLEVGRAVASRNFAQVETLFAQAKGQPPTATGRVRSDMVVEALDLVSHAPDRSEQMWQHIEAQGEAWRQAFPASSLGAYMRSQTQLNRAMAVRGFGPAGAVQTATWASFDAFVQKATDSLRQAEGTVVQDEVWHTALLKAARHQRLETAAVRRLVEAAVARYPDYAPIYRVAAMRLGTAGGGSAEDLEWLANLALRKSSVSGSWLPYTWVYADLPWGALGGSLLDATAMDWKKLRAGFDEMVARYPAPSHLNNYAWFACRARDQATLAALITRLGDQLGGERWGAVEQTACVRFARAPRKGPGSEVVATPEQFRSMLRDNDFDGIEQKYAEIVAANARTEAGVPYAEQFMEYPAGRCAVTDRAVREAALGTPLERETQAVRDARTAACRQRFEDKMLAWQKRFPDSSLAAVGLSDTYLRANDVKPSPPLAVMDAALERGQAVLQSVPAAKRDVYWYQQHLWVGSLQGWNPARYKQVLQEAVTRFPDRPSLYRRAVTHFLPANGGSLADVDAVARGGLARNEDIPTGLLMYANAYDELAFGSGNFHDLAYQRTLVKWPEMLAGLHEMRRRYPGIWTDNRTANHACLAGDMDTLRAMLSRTRTTQFPDHGWATGWRERCVRRLEQQDKQEIPSAKPNT